jgi:hypothetical protein
MMKRLFLILAIALTSCSADETNTTSTAEANCRCSTILEANVFGLPTGQSFTAGVMENDCSGVQKNFNLNGVYRVGQKICD